MNVFNDKIIEIIESNVFNGKMNVFKGYINLNDWLILMIKKWKSSHHAGPKGRQL